MRLRFAPSPTGNLHLGGLRTALFNHIICRQNQGSLVLRIEDTDQSRKVEGSLESLVKDLKWCGLDFNESFDAGGNYGPYMQSLRLDLYQHYASKLMDSSHAYKCFCTNQRLQTLRAVCLEKNQKPMYDGKCRQMSGGQRLAALDAKTPFVVRFKVLPRLHCVFNSKSSTLPTSYKEWNDVKTVRCAQEDPILMKSDGWPTYHLAHVVDDYLMQITHVIRGQEWLPSVPLHIQLYHALNLTPPTYKHLPLLLSQAGAKLSKRVGDVGIEWFRDRGYDPSALLIFAGNQGRSGRRAESVEELYEQFDILEVTKSVRLDMHQLNAISRSLISSKNALKMEMLKRQIAAALFVVIRVLMLKKAVG